MTSFWVNLGLILSESRHFELVCLNVKFNQSRPSENLTLMGPQIDIHIYLARRMLDTSLRMRLMILDFLFYCINLKFVKDAMILVRNDMNE